MNFLNYIPGFGTSTPAHLTQIGYNEEISASPAESKYIMTVQHEQTANKFMELEAKIKELELHNSTQDTLISQLKKKDKKIDELGKSLERFESEIESLALDAIAHADDKQKLALWVPVTRPCFDSMQAVVLETLVLHHCSKLKDEDFDGFKDFINLRKLTLNKCNNKGLMEEFIDKLPKNSLKELYIGGLATVTDKLFSCLPNFLTKLGLRTSGEMELSNKKMGSFPMTITELTLGRVYKLNKEGIKNLANKNPDLTHLNISRSKNIKNDSLPHFPHKLVALYMHDCSIEGTSNIAKLTQVKTLGVNNWNCPKHSLIDAFPDNIKLLCVSNAENKKAFEDIIKIKERSIEVSNVGVFIKFT